MRAVRGETTRRGMGRVAPTTATVGVGEAFAAAVESELDDTEPVDTELDDTELFFDDAESDFLSCDLCCVTKSCDSFVSGRLRSLPPGRNQGLGLSSVDFHD